MGNIQRRTFLSVGLVLIASASVLLLTAPSSRALESLPDRISDREYWQIVSDFSEEDGYFRFENFLSNEEAFQYVIPTLKEMTQSGGAYLGVGPEQNFTYLAALRPKIAFIIDIRRQNMLEHLMYKALFELSPDRVDFVARLFSRRRPPGLNTKLSAAELFRAFSQAEPDPQLFAGNLQAIREVLVKRHKFGLSWDDERKIEYVYKAFFEAGPGLDFSTGGFSASSGSPTYERLMTATDRQGRHRSYLASEENFQIVREMERNNIVIPLVGDFAGNKTILAVAQYLKEHDAKVTAFYLSNVEQYLFQKGDDWRRFYTNVAALPMDSSSTFIRSASSGNSFQARTSSFRFISVVSSMREIIEAHGAGRIRSYYDVIRMSN
jgi:hypothetical protein